MSSFFYLNKINFFMKKHLLLITFFITTISFAQHRIIIDRKIDEEVYIKDATQYLKPGDTVQLAGHYKFFKIYNISGTEEKPIVFINKGLVTIGGFPPYVGFFSGKNFKVLGNGDANFKYGIHFTSTNKNKYGNFGISLDNSTGVEIAYCEFSKVSTGILHNPTTGKSITNCYYHDNYLHDLDSPGPNGKGKSVGLYIGSIDYFNRNKPDSFINCKIENNKLEHISGIGIQVASGNFNISGNSISNYGFSQLEENNVAIDLELGASGNVVNNLVDSSQSMGLSIYGSGLIEVSSNKFTHLTLADRKYNTVVFINAKGKFPLKLNFHNNYINGSSNGAVIANITKDELNRGSTFSSNKIDGEFKKIYSILPKDKIVNTLK